MPVVIDVLVYYMKPLPEVIQRIYTAIPLISIAAAATFYFNFLSFVILDTLLLLVLGWEWIRMSGYATSFARYFYLVALLMGCASAHYLPVSWVFQLSGFMGMMLVSYMVIVLYQKQRFRHSAWLLASLGGVYFILNWYTLWSLKETPMYLGMGLLIIMLTDTLAYFVGNRWGAHPLAPAISPNKTWEGFLAGLFGPLVLILIIDRLSSSPFHVNKQMAVVILCTALTAIAGDLFESAIKRQHGLKDSGDGLPGHGGWLDRCDSLVCAMPVFAAGLFYLIIP
jgi:phosphatidate cytidylyltransferase